MRDNKIIRACTVAQSVGFFAPMIPDFMKMGYEVVAVCSEGEETEKVLNAGGRYVPVEMERHISPLKDLKSLWNLVKVFRKEKPMMVHSMTPKAGLLCMMAGKITGVPVRLHTFTGLVFPTAKGLTQKILILTDRMTCACATNIIPEGEGVKSDLIKFKITKKPLRVLGHGNVRGIDLDRFDPENADIKAEADQIKVRLNAATKSGKVCTFIFIGRMVGDKGINELVEAFSKLNNEIPNTRLLLVGRYEPELDPIKTETVKEIENNNAIMAVGQQSDVRPWLSASDALVFPSYREGFPNVVIEAGAMGLPSIVTDINGSREIIIEGKNGTIIPSHDAEALYESMKRFAIDTDYRQNLATNARELIASRYEQGFVRKCLLDYYKEILK